MFEKSQFNTQRNIGKGIMDSSFFEKHIIKCCSTHWPLQQNSHHSLSFLVFHFHLQNMVVKMGVRILQLQNHEKKSENIKPDNINITHFKACKNTNEIYNQAPIRASPCWIIKEGSSIRRKIKVGKFFLF